MRSFTPIQKILDGVTADGAGTAILVEDLEYIVVSLDTTDSTTATIKAQGSIADVEPTWGSAQSPTNQWDYIQMRDYEDASAVDGDAGVALSGTDTNRQFRVNVDGLKYFNLIVSGYSQGTIHGKMKGFSDK